MKHIILVLQFSLIFMQTLKPCQGIASIGGIGIPWRSNTVYRVTAVFLQGFTNFQNPALECYGGKQRGMRSGRKAKNSSSGRPVLSFLFILPSNTNSKHYEQLFTHDQIYYLKQNKHKQVPKS